MKLLAFLPCHHARKAYPIKLLSPRQNKANLRTLTINGAIGEAKTCNLIPLGIYRSLLGQNNARIKKHMNLKVTGFVVRGYMIFL